MHSKSYMLPPFDTFQEYIDKARETMLPLLFLGRPSPLAHPSRSFLAAVASVCSVFGTRALDEMCWVFRGIFVYFLHYGLGQVHVALRSDDTRTDSRSGFIEKMGKRKTHQTKLTRGVRKGEGRGCKQDV